jgi:GDP-4-dehydro-6-deoxy-D-mannose reductase
VRTLLLTGHSGFVGRALRDVLHSDPGLAHWRLTTLPEHFDIRSAELEGQVASARPDAVIHLAGLTSVADSFRDAEAFFDVNFGGTWNLLKALRSAGFSGRFLFVSSGDCYGAVGPDELPIPETHPLRPRSPYAVSKVAAEALCCQWAQTERLDAVIARAFNHIGRGQDIRFAIASFARQVARIRRGLAPPQIVTGDLDVTRDLTDVRDVVHAYFALIENGRTGEVYNVGSGRETRLRDVVEGLLEAAEISATLVTDAARVRQGEQRRAVADVRKIAGDTGWSSSIPLSSTLGDILDDWLERIRLE